MPSVFAPYTKNSASKIVSDYFGISKNEAIDYCTQMAADYVANDMKSAIPSTLDEMQKYMATRATLSFNND